MTKNKTASLIIILISFIVGIYFYSEMPEKMISSWDINGEPNGSMTKFWGLFAIPLMSLGLFILFMFLPKIDPLKENIEKFKKHFDAFILVFTFFIFYLYVLTILWNIGITFNIVQFLTPSFGVLYLFLGHLIENSKRNWFIGIRTPWTLSSDEVWDKTHKLGGGLFKIAGFIAFGSFALPHIAFFLVVFPVVFFSLYTTVYSYLEYKKMQRIK